MRRSESYMKIAAAVLSAVMAVLFLVIVLPDVSRAYISNILLHYPGIDKLVHFVEFLLIMCMTYLFLSLRMFAFPRNKKVGISLLFSLSISVIDEYHQLLIPKRSFEYADLLVNTAGILTGTIIILFKKIRLSVILPVLAVIVWVVSLVTSDSYRKMKHFNMGILYERENNYPDAMKHYLLALRSGNESPALYNNMAWINIEFLNGDPEVSLEYVKKALALNPDSADIIETYGWILYKLNQPGEAIIHLKKAQEINPDIYCVNYHLGASYFALGDYKSSLYYLNKQIELNAENRYASQSRELIERIEKEHI